ncbi:hypothetical protein FHR32_005916 [Streptosporangium album]|uniref:DUF4352 domain-containing protein n=1 Tax=Streptosporangium album TaxID=47479 RepID=A0A7W7S0A7_9ACTN|nr:DUF4352 domain-containing protein [Streptosporangium album]MBB4941539.1 hypothetical protein [Streptosporangium album]
MTVAAGVIIVITLVGVVVTAVGCGGNCGRDTFGEPVDRSAKNRAIGIGKKVREGSFEFTVTKVTTASSVGDGPLARRARGRFLLVHLTVRNIGGEARIFFGDNQKVSDDKGHEYLADSNAATSDPHSKSLYEEIKPGDKVSGVVAFDVPRDRKVTTIELHESMFSDGVHVPLKF